MTGVEGGGGAYVQSQFISVLINDMTTDFIVQKFTDQKCRTSSRALTLQLLSVQLGKYLQGFSLFPTPPPTFLSKPSTSVLTLTSTYLSFPWIEEI